VFSQVVAGYKKKEKLAGIFLFSVNTAISKAKEVIEGMRFSIYV
jgi:hypothetical protein